jgi:RimJ/RimL family protein N-acetyltransferase
MARTSAWNVIRRDIKHFGLWCTVVDVFFRAVNYLCYFRIVRAVVLEAVKPEYLDDGNLNWQFFSAEELHDLAADSSNEITEKFLDDALAKGDRCYGAMDGDALVTYAWMSHKPTDADGLVVHFDPAYAYFFKAFTSPHYRGKRLNSICAHRALRHCVSDGYRGFIADIDAHNFASLYAADRMGFVKFGQATIFKLGRVPLIHLSRGCQKYGYFFRPARREKTDRETPQAAESLVSAP